MAHKLAPATHFSVPDNGQRVTNVFNNLIKRYFSPFWCRNQKLDSSRFHLERVIFVRNTSRFMLRMLEKQHCERLYFAGFFFPLNPKKPTRKTLMNKWLDIMDRTIWRMRMSIPDYGRKLNYHTWIRFNWFSTTWGCIRSMTCVRTSLPSWPLSTATRQMHSDGRRFCRPPCGAQKRRPSHFIQRFQASILDQVYQWPDLLIR